MRLARIQFSGYKAFSPPEYESDDAPTLTLEPLTLILGKNNIGKSAVVRLPRLVLGALAGEGHGIVPLKVRGHSFGWTVTDVLHGHSRLTRLRFDIKASRAGESLALSMELGVRPSSDAFVPLSWTMRAPTELATGGDLLGCLPNSSQWAPWRDAAGALLDSMVHIGPLRAPIEPVYPASEPTPISGDGREAPSWLAADAELAQSVGAWFERHQGGWALRVERNGPAFGLVVQRGPTMKANVAAAGHGFHQVLPVVVHQHMRQRSLDGPFLDIIEQPELHLHAAAQAPLADLFLDTARTGRGCTIVETHSEQILLRVQRRVAEDPTLDPDRIAVYFVDEHPERPGSRIRRIPLDRAGELAWWPDGVFKEDFDEVMAIRRAQRAHQPSVAVIDG